MIGNKNEYNLVYQDTFTGGFVYLHPNQNKQEREINVIVGTFLAKNGFRVWLIPPVDKIHIKTADAWLENENICIEFKHCQTPTSSAIDKAIQKAKKQAQHILLYIDCEVTLNNLINGIEDRTQRPENKNVIESIWIIWDNQFWQFSRKQILDKVCRNTLKIE